MKRVLLLGIATACLSFAGCSSDNDNGATTPTKPCNEDPWGCPDGQTCWATSGIGDYKCLNSDSSKQKGDACSNIIEHPTCGDDLSCYAVGTPSGVCAPFCDPTNADRKCATGEICMTLKFPGGTELIHVCSPPNAPEDAGTDSAASDAAEADGAADAQEEAGDEPGEDAAGPDVADDVIPPADASAD